MKSDQETAGEGEKKPKGRNKGMWNPEDRGLPFELVEEDRRPVSMKKLDMMKAAHEAWWRASHGNSEEAYARSRDELYTLVVEYLPELLDLARNTLIIRQG